jgi:O-antigen/teichoic acid export membrane protein
LSVVVRNSVTNAIATGSLVSGGALCTIVIAQMLGPHSLGVVSYAMWLIGLAVIVADLGIPSALTRFLPEVLQTERGGEEDGARVSDGLTAALMRAFASAVAAVMLVCGVVVAGLVLSDPGGRTGIGIDPDDYLHNPLFWGLVAVGTGGQSLVVLALGLLRGRQEFGRLARIASASALLQILATAVGTALFGISGAIAGAAFLGAIPGIFLVLSLRRGGAIEKPLRTRVVRYCGTYWVSYLLQAVTNTRTEIFFLARSFGTEAVALFSIGVTLANIAVQVPILLTGSLLPHISQHMAAGDHARAADLYRTSLRIMAMMAFPACLGVAAIAPILIPLLYGKGFVDAVLPAAILMGASAASALASVAQIYMNAAERNVFSIGAGLAGAAAVVVSGLLLVPLYGVLAAALVRGGVQLFTAGFSLWYVQRHLGAPAPLGIIARILCAAFVCAGAAYCFVLLIPGPASLLVAIPVSIVTYLVALRLFSCLTFEDLASIDRMSGALPRPLSSAVKGILRLYADKTLRVGKRLPG